MNFAEDLKISPEDLDLEWLRQPQLYAKYAQEVSRLKVAADRAKERVEVVRAQLDGAIRTAPEAFGLAKVTETAIAGAIQLHESYMEAKEEQFRAAEEASQGFNALGALDHRKAALENLVKLHLAHYFAGPASPRAIGTLWKERADERQQERVQEALDARRGKRTR